MHLLDAWYARKPMNSPQRWLHDLIRHIRDGDIWGTDEGGVPQVLGRE